MTSANLSCPMLMSILGIGYLRVEAVWENNYFISVIISSESVIHW